MMIGLLHSDTHQIRRSESYLCQSVLMTNPLTPWVRVAHGLAALLPLLHDGFNLRTDVAADQHCSHRERSPRWILSRAIIPMHSRSCTLCWCFCLCSTIAPIRKQLNQRTRAAQRPLCIGNFDSHHKDGVGAPALRHKRCKTM